MALPRMRTASGVLAEIKAQDPDTELTLYYIRQIIHENRIPVLEIGRKKLVNVDDVLAHISTESRVVEPEPDFKTGIRRVAL